MTIHLGDLRSEVATIAREPENLDRVVFLLLHAPKHEARSWLHYTLDVLGRVTVGRHQRRMTAASVVEYALTIGEILGEYGHELKVNAAAGAAWALVRWAKGKAQSDGPIVAVPTEDTRPRAQRLRFHRRSQRVLEVSGRPGHMKVQESWRGSGFDGSRPVSVYPYGTTWQPFRLRRLRELAPAQLPLFAS